MLLDKSELNSLLKTIIHKKSIIKDENDKLVSYDFTKLVCLNFTWSDDKIEIETSYEKASGRFYIRIDFKEFKTKRKVNGHLWWKTYEDCYMVDGMWIFNEIAKAIAPLIEKEKKIAKIIDEVPDMKGRIDWNLYHTHFETDITLATLVIDYARKNGAPFIEEYEDYVTSKFACAAKNSIVTKWSPKCVYYSYDEWYEDIFKPQAELKLKQEDIEKRAEAVGLDRIIKIANEKAKNNLYNY